MDDDQGAQGDQGAGGHVTITGGGTAGHVHPGLALAEELRRRGWSVSWIGRAGSVEERLVSAVGVPFDGVPASPIVGRGPLGRCRAIAIGLRGALAARAPLARRTADVVVGTGGYVSFPGVVAAWSRRIPVLLFESNATMGVANRVLSRFAQRVAWGHGAADDTERTVTGVPVDASFADHRADPTAAGAPDEAPPRILVLGGSQGSEQLNRAVPAALGRAGEFGWAPARVIHQCGYGHLDATRDRYAGIEADAEVTVVEYIGEVAAAMTEADVIISRAGAQTLAELTAVGRPALLVPLGAAHGHQAQNAELLAAAGAAWSLPGLEDEELAAALAERVGSLFADRRRLRAAAEAMASLATPDAAARLTDVVIEMAEAEAG